MEAHKCKSTSLKDLEQYYTSLQRSSNMTSNILLSDAVENHVNTFCCNNIEQTLHGIVDNKELDSTRNKWISNMKGIDVTALFENSIPKCPNCTEHFNYDLRHMKNNNCKCHLAKFTEKEEPRENKSNIMYLKNLDCYAVEEKSSEHITPLFKPKFRSFKHAKKSAATTSNYIDLSDVNDVIEIEEDKTHSTNDNKLAFKTAREQFLASNPAAKRKLGTSKRAQAKFVSPMLVQDRDERTEDNQAPPMDDRTKHIDPKMIELIESEIMDRGTTIGWDDIAGLQMAKSVIQEAVVWPLLRPDIFTGLRRPPKGILLFGPPGTGKTLIGKCVASQCHATFFNISASSLTSKWIGDGEKMVRALFAVASCHQPAVIFIDEIDSLLTQRSDSEHEATRRIKTEFLVQFDGAGTGEEDRLLIIGATNRPQELDEAARRRLVKRLYIPLPEQQARKQIIENLLKNESHSLRLQDVEDVALLTDGYSGADMKSLCSEAAMGPIRSVPFSQIVSIQRDNVRAVNIEDFKNALKRVKPSVSQDDLGVYVNWNTTYGQGF